jgi:cardiolipin synthase
MQAMFAADLEASQAIDLQAWEQRPIQFQVKEWMAQMWGRLL